MHLFYTVVIALANNIDNMGARIAYSIRGIKISNLMNLWISIITFIISSLAAFSGTAISEFLSRQVASYISMTLLIAIGIWMILDQYTKKNDIPADKVSSESDKSILNILKNPEKADIDNSKNIDFIEATLLGIALSINNIGGGLSAGMIGLNPLFVGLLSAIVSFSALWAGNYLAEFFNVRKLGNKTAILAGVAMIFLGIKQII